MIAAKWLIFSLAVAASDAPARRPAAPPPAEEAICVGGPQWRASLLDTRQIEAAPVPASYRQLFESRPPCLESDTNQASLVDWHIRFGSEPGIAAALAYIELSYSRDAALIGTYRRELERAWHAALPDLRNAQAMHQPQGLDYSIQYRFTQASRTISRFEALVRVRETYIFLAQQYLRAAEEFGSLALLDKAAHYLQPAVDGGAFLAPLEHQPPVANLLYFNLHVFRTDDLRMREAVLRAHLTRAPTDLAEAERVLQSVEQPYYRRLAEAAFGSGGGFCDIDHGASGWEELAAACNADDEMNEHVVPYWINRAMLGYVLPPAENRRDDELALRLLQEERLPDRGRCCGSRADDDLFRLYLMQADQQRRVFVEAAARHDWFETQWHLHQALSALEKAECLTQAAEAPARFQRVAEAWLDLWARGAALRHDSEDGVGSVAGSPERRRYASYLRQLLAGLDRIAAGSDAGLPPTQN
jgi:hypothetical protein